MKTILLLFLLSGTVLAGPYIGFAQGIHLNGEEIQDSHPYVGFEYKQFGVLGYVNSFNKVGFAPYYEFRSGKEVLRFSIKLGVTTGYSPRMSYGDHTYSLDRRFFFSNKLMLFIVPGVSMGYNGISIDLTLLGDSINMGLTLRY